MASWTEEHTKALFPALTQDEAVEWDAMLEAGVDVHEVARIIWVGRCLAAAVPQEGEEP